MTTYSFNPEIKKTNSKFRNIVNLLPGINQTETVKKFFNSSANHLFQPGDGQQISGYIGTIPKWYNPLKDHYIGEPTKSRSFYQLEPTMASRDSSTEVFTNVLFYEDIINQLSLQGSITSNQSRLFDEEFYTWCPPIDLDKFINFRKYFWVNTTLPDYITIEKNSSDGNPWSVDNSWAHMDDIKDTVSYTQAVRPIIEFEKNIELYNYGRNRRVNVDYIIYNGNIEGFSFLKTFNIDGDDYTVSTLPEEGLRVLTLQDINDQNSNKIFNITTNKGSTIAVVESDGLDPYGNPTLSDIVKVTKGSYKNKEFYFNGDFWISAQEKGKEPLFQLYDFKGTSLSNDVEYPQCDFTGSKIFGFNLDTTGTIKEDSVIQESITHDNNGQIQFNNYISTQIFKSNNNDIKGYYFFNKMGKEDLLENCWRKSPLISRQMVIDNFTSDGVLKSFTLSQIPDKDTQGWNSNIEVSLSTEGSDNVTDIVSSNLIENIDYFLIDNTLMVPNINKGDTLEVRTFSSKSNTGEGFYEVPSNLSSNPLNSNITIMTKGDVYEHFTEIMSNQIGFQGKVYDSNNWRETVKNKTLGTKLIQHSSSMLPLMLCESSSLLDIPTSITFAEESYILFKNKFEKYLEVIINKGLLSTSQDPNIWIDFTLEELSKGCNESSPFLNSGMGITGQHIIDYFVPPTPSFLGMYPVSKPEIFVDYTIPSLPSFIVGHDGSMTLCYGDFRDSVILAWENRIYDSILDKFKEDVILKSKSFVSTPFFTSQYSQDEYNSILSQGFNKFISQMGIDSLSNKTFDSSNPFTFNWSSVESKITNELLPGNWRGIYKEYYNTDRPHICPWEMLGFSNKPSWWDGRYGLMPDYQSTGVNYYTEDNDILWNDIKTGYIADGSRKGFDISYAIPNIYDIIPTDHQGNLKDPVECNIAKNYPTITNASMDWKFGDGGPAETLWRRSPSFSFAEIKTLFLMKPARFVGLLWDCQNTEILMKGLDSQQNINTLTGSRDYFRTAQVHGEVLNNSFVQRYGIQQFISNYLMENNKSISSFFGDALRNIDVRLAHKVAGFTSNDNLTISTDTNDIIPKEDINVLLYSSPVENQSNYTGVIIKKEETVWTVYGFDTIDTNFKIIPPNQDLGGSTISVGKNNITRIYSWKPNSYYEKGIVVRNDSDYLLCLKSHTSSQFIEDSYWSKTDRQDYSIEDSAVWFDFGLDVEETVPYNTSFSSIQEVVNFLNGLQRYQKSKGWQFNEVNDNGVLEDWKSSAKSFIAWQLDFTNNGNFISLSPMADKAVLNLNHGIVGNLETIQNGQYGIVNKSGSAIEPYQLSIFRDQETVSITPIDNEIFGIKPSINELEHIIVFNNKTVFGDVIYNPTMSVRQPRLKVQGFKTTDWNGRLEAPGFIISGNKLIPNFEKTTNDFRTLFDIETVDYSDLQEHARSNIGYYERPYMTNLNMSSTNQLEFYQGMIQDKGTVSVFDKLMRSSFIRNNKDITFHEEWAFRIGTYGADEIQPSIDFSISWEDIMNNPQLIEFNTSWEDDTWNKSFLITNSNTIELLNDSQESIIEIHELHLSTNTAEFPKNITVSIYGYLNGEKIPLVNNYTGGDWKTKFKFPIKIDSPLLTVSNDTGENINFEISFKTQKTQKPYQNINYNINIMDIRSNQTNKFISKDSRWNDRNIETVEWPTKMYSQINKGFLPNAGYVNVDTVSWTCFTNDNFYNLFSSIKEEKEDTNLQNSFSWKLNGGSPKVTVSKLIDSKSNGYFRVNKVSVQLDKKPLLDTVINIGLKNQLPDGINNTYSPNLIHRFTYEDIQNNTSLVSYPSNLWKLDGNDNSIYVQICTLDSSDFDKRLNLGDLTISIEVDWLEDSVLPGDKVWIYDTGAGDWTTKILQDSKLLIETVTPPSFDGQGSVVALQGFTNEPQNLLGEDFILTFDGIQNMDTGELETVYRPLYSNSVSVIVDGSNPKTPLLTMNTDAEMNINQVSINVLKPFTTSDGSDMVFTIGNESNSDYLASSNIISNPIPQKPSFDVSVPVTVKLVNKTITANKTNGSIDIHFVRYGNIYGIPQTCVNLPNTSLVWSWSAFDSTGNQIGDEQIGGTVSFGNPQNSNDIMESYWHGVGSLDISQYPSYQIRISSVTNAVLDPMISTVSVLVGNTMTSFDPTKTGKQDINTDAFDSNTSNDPLYVNIGPNTSGLAIITVNYGYKNGFEIFNLDKTPYVIDNICNGGNIFYWLQSRFSTEQDMMNSSYYPLFDNGSFVEIDNGDNWIIKELQNNNWTVSYNKTPKVITSSLESAVVYDETYNKVQNILEVYDPFKGFLPKSCISELTYLLDFDPAVYNFTNQGILDYETQWGASHVGELWWDLRTVRYIDYESNDTQYRMKYWGAMAPGSSIDIYEWVRSPVIPQGWDVYKSGTPANGFDQTPSGEISPDTKWVEITEWNSNTQSYTPTYYFWVKNPTTVSSSPNRKKSASNISQIITNPWNNDIPCFSVIDSNKIIISNTNEFIGSKTNIKIKWNDNPQDINFHKQWNIMRTTDKDQTMDPYLWKKMSDSLVGFSIQTDSLSITGSSNSTIPNNTMGNVELVNIKGDLSSAPFSGEVRIGEFWFTYSSIEKDTLIGIMNDSGTMISPRELIYIPYIQETVNQVPDQSLVKNEQLGNLNRPNQSWFPSDGISSREARKVFVDIFNNIASREPYVDNWYNWNSILEKSSEKPLPTSYNFQADDFLYRNQLVTNGHISLNQQVLVEGSTSTNGFWTLWKYDPINPLSDAEGFYLVDSQKMRLQAGEFWDYVDWYADGWSENDFPQYRFSSIQERDSSPIDVTLLNGTLVEINDGTSWVRYVYNSSGWVMVGKEKATFKLLDSFYTSNIDYGFSNLNLNNIQLRDGSYELKWLLENLSSLITNSQLLEIFFTMVKYSVSIDTNIDWAFKTSFMYLGGYTEQLNQEPVEFVDQMDNIRDFITEVKPYHVALRDYITTLGAGPDYAYLHATDYDFPMYKDDNSHVRKLFPIVSSPYNGSPGSRNPGNPIDDNIVSSTFPWADWHSAYLKSNYDSSNWNTDWNPVRHLITNMKYDRVVCSVNQGWDPIDFSWDPISFDYWENQTINSSELFDQYRTERPNQYNDQNVLHFSNLKTPNKSGTLGYVYDKQVFYMWVDTTWVELDSVMWDIEWKGQGEAGRIQEYYEPTYDMLKKDDTGNLISGCGFRGTEVIGGSLAQGSWDIFSYDTDGGWANEFAYYDGGIDIQSSIPVNESSQPKGETVALKNDVRGRDIDITGGDFSNEDTEITIDGGTLDQPYYSEDHPEERIPTKVLNSLIITITDKDKDYRAIVSYSNINQWEFIKIQNGGYSIDTDDTNSILINCSDGFKLHDPNNPSVEYLDKVKSSYVDLKLNQNEIDKITGRLLPGVIWIETVKGGISLWEKVQYWQVDKVSETQYRLGALQREYDGTTNYNESGFSLNSTKIHKQGTPVYDGSVIQWLTPRNQIMKNILRNNPNIRYEKIDNHWGLQNFDFTSR